MRRFSLPILLLTAACGETSAPRPVEVLPTWIATEELRIGSVDQPGYTLTHVGSLVVTRDDRILVSQPQEGLIRAYDREGRILRTIGGPGPGPGEFTNLGAIGVLGDSLYASDHGGRITFFDLEDWSLIGTETRPAARSLGWRSEQLLAGGRVLVTDSYTTGDPVWMLVELGGHLRDTLFVGPAGSITAPFGGGAYYLSNIFSASRPPFFFIAGDGSRFATISWEARRKEEGVATVSVVTVDGDTLFQRELEYVPVPWASAYVDSVIADATKTVEQRLGVSRSSAEAMVLEQTHPRDYMPAIGYAVFSEEGDLWIWRRLSARPPLGTGTGPLGRWKVLDTRGNPIALVQAAGPDSAELTVAPYVIRGSHFWGMAHDEFGVPYVVRYRLDRER
jgi:hypothetical protein